MQRQKAAELIGYSRQRAKAMGYMIWPVTLGIGLISWYLWEWYSFIIAIVAAYFIGSFYSYTESKRLQKLTGLSISEMQYLYYESAVAKRDPIAKDPTKYKSYIDALPDDE